MSIQKTSKSSERIVKAMEEIDSQASLQCDSVRGSIPPKLFRRLKTKPRGFAEETIVSPGCSSSKEVELESSVWRNLPEELVDRIMAWLPPIFFIRLQGVCKRWRDILNEHGFLRLLSQLPTHGPCFLITQKNGDIWHSAMYSHPMRQWHSLPLISTPKKAHSLIASAGGLLCFSALVGRHDELFICNPFRREYRQVPDMHHKRQLGFVNMFMDTKSRSYRIVAAGDYSYLGGNNRAFPTEVYDSKSNSWAIYDSVPVGILHSSKSAFCNGRLYCLTSYPCGLVAFDVDRGLWESVPVRMPHSLLDAFLVAGEYGCLLLVGRTGLYSVHQSMRIWELNLQKMDWTEVGKMPHILFNGWLKSIAESFQCFGNGNCIFFAAQKYQKWLVYDLMKKCWYSFGGCPLISGSPGKSLKGIFFEPRLDTLVHQQ
ncbi:hypothetical protein KP509_01G033100 [Ceratopteris richardii]|nr:hypothetical protein KP509_01G033100 [Ceratopteris richardii]KAH7446018.1 hypothetical protein KP509_01G033100 [Ceratopteris richardii]KAH7446021.1 hypothetical protein KP509_01G033100 [Ceratopteris richardii]